MASKKIQNNQRDRLPPSGALSRQSNSVSSLQGSNVQVHVLVDPNRAMGQLFQHRDQPRFEKRPKQATLPPTFWMPKKKGSSAGHSPQGSSDDSGLNSLGHTATTLSPVAPVIQPIHRRQQSAPEQGQHAENFARFPPIGGRQLPASAATSPHAPSMHAMPSPQQPAFSRSYSGIDSAALHEMNEFHGGPMHERSLSHDVTTHQAMQQQHFGYPQPHHGSNQDFTMHHQAQQQHQLMQQQLMQPLREKSRSAPMLDPMMIAEPMQVQQQAAQQPQPQQQAVMPHAQLMEGLPPGWSAAIDPTSGDIYYMNHIEKKTTWYDPRLPVHEQEEDIRRKHNFVLAEKQAQQHQQQFAMQQPIHATFSTSQDFSQQMQQMNLGQDYNNPSMHQFYTASQPSSHGNPQQPQVPQQQQQPAMVMQQTYEHPRSFSNDSAMETDQNADYAGYDFSSVRPEELDIYIKQQQQGSQLSQYQ